MTNNISTSNSSLPNAISVSELHRLLQKDRSITLLDVREPHEYQICRLDNTILMPMYELATHYKDLNPDNFIVVYCRSGVRSHHATMFLRSHGFKKAVNLSGGILAWAKEIDPSLPTY